jgi:small subunit ribosomal protein S3
MAFRKVLYQCRRDLEAVSAVKGFKVQLAGRLGGVEIARTEWIRGGQVPLQTLQANISYTSYPVNTRYGIIGVKVWIFKK